MPFLREIFTWHYNKTYLTSSLQGSGREYSMILGWSWQVLMFVRSFSKILHYSQDSHVSFCSFSKSNGKENKISINRKGRQRLQFLIFVSSNIAVISRFFFLKYPDRMITSLIKKIGKSLERAIGSFSSHVDSFYRKRTKSPKVRI